MPFLAELLKQLHQGWCLLPFEALLPSERASTGTAVLHSVDRHGRGVSFWPTSRLCYRRGWERVSSFPCAQEVEIGLVNITGSPEPPEESLTNLGTRNNQSLFSHSPGDQMSEIKELWGVLPPEALEENLLCGLLLASPDDQQPSMCLDSQMHHPHLCLLGHRATFSLSVSLLFL